MNNPLPVFGDPEGLDSARPRLLIFDVNQTLSDMGPLGARIADLGLPEHLATTWFAGVLRDGFALAAAGATAPFAEVAVESLRVLFSTDAPNRDLQEAVTYVMQGFTGLGVHPDVVTGLDALAELDIRMVTLSNGPVSAAQSLLTGAGVRQHFERLLSVEDVGAWKPAGPSYAYALAQCKVAPADAMLVAVHPWDTDGAARAGLASAWINRHAATYPAYFLAPTHQADSLVGLAQQLA